MKKFIGFFKKKDELEGIEEQKYFSDQPKENDIPSDKEGASTKGGDSSNSNSNPDQASKEAKLEEIKRSMLDRKVKKFEDQLNKK